MASRINIGPENGPYVAINESSGNLQLEDNSGNVVAEWDETNAQWDFANNTLNNVDALNSDSVSTVDSTSDRLQANELSADRLRDVYRADEPVPLSSGIQVQEGVGVLRNIDVRGGIAYTTDRDEFATFDISSPRRAGKLDAVADDPELDGINDFVVSGRYAYSSARDSNQFTVLDISNPKDISIEASISVSADLLYGVALRDSDSTAFVVGRDNNMVSAVDVSDPSNPSEVGTVSDAGLGGATGVDIIDETYIIVAARDTHSVLTIDAESPSNLSIVDQLTDTTVLKKADEIIVHRRGVDRDYAFHVGGTKSDPNDRFASIDISDPTNLSIAHQIQSPELSNSGSVGADIQGNYVYASIRSDGGIVTFDVSDPENLEQVDSISIGDDSHDAAVNGNYVYDAQPGSDSFWIIGAAGSDTSLVRANLDDSQSILAGERETVQFDDLEVDTLGEWDMTNDEFVPDETGWFFVSAHVSFVSGSDGDRVLAMFFDKNGGSAELRSEIEGADPSGQVTVTISGLVQMQAGNGYDVRAENETSDDLIFSGGGMTNVSIHRAGI